MVIVTATTEKGGYSGSSVITAIITVTSIMIGGSLWSTRRTVIRLVTPDYTYYADHEGYVDIVLSSTAYFIRVGDRILSYFTLNYSRRRYRSIYGVGSFVSYR